MDPNLIEEQIDLCRKYFDNNKIEDDDYHKNVTALLDLIKYNYDKVATHFESCTQVVEYCNKCKKEFNQDKIFEEDYIKQDNSKFLRRKYKGFEDSQFYCKIPKYFYTLKCMYYKNPVTKIYEIPGIGENEVKKLKEHNITTVQELIDLFVNELKQCRLCFKIKLNKDFGIDLTNAKACSYAYGDCSF